MKDIVLHISSPSQDLIDRLSRTIDEDEVLVLNVLGRTFRVDLDAIEVDG